MFRTTKGQGTSQLNWKVDDCPEFLNREKWWESVVIAEFLERQACQSPVAGSITFMMREATRFPSRYINDAYINLM